MNSIYERALGEEFQHLHPKYQEKFRLSSSDQQALICTGMMEEISGGRWFMRPFIHIGIKRNITFPERGTQIPFTLEKYAFKDPHGRETVSWIRTFHFKNVDRRFDASMVFSEKEKGVIDYLGNVQTSPVGISLKVTETGGILLCSTNQLFQFGPKETAIPSKMIGEAIVHENYDDDKDRFTIDVTVKNALFGIIFRYKGYFRMEVISMPSEQIPQYAFPKKFDIRE